MLRTCSKRRCLGRRSLHRYRPQVSDPHPDSEKGLRASGGAGGTQPRPRRTRRRIPIHALEAGRRSADYLEEAIERIKEIKTSIPRIRVPEAKRYNFEWIDAIEFSLMIEAAEVIVRSALARQESRGSHYRKDFPERDDEDWLKW